MLIGKFDEGSGMYDTASVDEVDTITSMDAWITAREAYWQAVSARDYYKGKVEAYERVLMAVMPMIVMKGEKE